jgi:DNA-directed RNA polymerase subunit beta
VLAKRAGTVEAVAGDQIWIRYDQADGKATAVDYTELAGVDTYRLTKFKRLNQDTCLNQRPVVAEGERVKRGQLLADGAATRNGELALGANVLVAFMPWGGYNFEDAILVSEHLIKDDRFTSIHIEEFELQVRDTKRGAEEITREIPNVSEESVKNLDEEGIVRIGARVRAGDILVGKVTPKGETDLTPEERLLRAIFGEKAGDVRDASLKAPPGMDGVVIDTKVFSRREKDETTKKQEKKKIERLRRQAKKDKDRVLETRAAEVAKILVGEYVNRWVEGDEATARSGKKIDEEFLTSADLDSIPYRTAVTRDDTVNDRFWNLMEGAARALDRVEKNLEKEIEKVTRGDELPPGVVKLVKVFVAK